MRVGSLEARVIDTPGHTAGHICYFFPAEKLVFVGDTLFSIGCGRVIEGNAQMMWNSLVKLRGLPDDARVYCGHEYTASQHPLRQDHRAGQQGARRARRRGRAPLAAGKPTIPATIAAEKAANPFLRADDAELAKSLGLSGSPPWQVFAEIRERKNRF